MYLRHFDRMFALGDPPDYEPSLNTSISALARQRGVTPDEIALDLLLENDGKAVLFVAVANFADGSLDNAYEMLKSEGTIFGLGDGGAHYGLICDASVPTFMLTYWTRDRTRGHKLHLAEVVKRLTADTASAVGLNDRGIVAPGYRADINVIDYGRLALHAPRMTADLPGGGRRLSQLATGYVATLVNGQITYRDGNPSSALPGRLIRGARAMPRAEPSDRPSVSSTHG